MLLVRNSEGRSPLERPKLIMRGRIDWIYSDRIADVRKTGDQTFAMKYGEFFKIRLSLCLKNIQITSSCNCRSTALIILRGISRLAEELSNV